MTTHRVVRPVSFVKCIAVKCSQTPWCARFQVEHAQGRPVEDFASQGACYSFVHIDAQIPASGPRVHPPIGSEV